MALKDYTSAINVLQLDGTSLIVGTPTITPLIVDSSQNVLLASGATVPTDADSGYAVGCLFLDTDSGVGYTLYINEGSATSADFNAVKTPSADPVFTGNVTIGDNVTDTLTIKSNILYNADAQAALRIGSSTQGTAMLITSSANVMIVQNGNFNDFLKFNTAGSAFAVFDLLGGVCSTATATSTTGITHNVAIRIAGVGTRYIKVYDTI